MKGSSWVPVDRSAVYVIGSVAKYLYDGDFFDWLYLSMRWMPVARSQDFFVLPDVWPMREFVPFLEQTLFDASPMQVIWVPPTHYLLDDVIAHHPKIVARLRELARSGAVFVPYTAVTDEFQRWFGQIQPAAVYGESQTWGRQWANKAWLHPWVNEPELQSVAEAHGLPVLRGYNASDNSGLLRAWELLRKQGVQSVGVKPLGSAFGNGIQSLAGLAEDQVMAFLRSYGFSHGAVMLEEWVEIDHDEYGEVSWSTHFIGNRLYQPACRQLVDHGTSAGNITPGFPAETLAELERLTARAINAINPQGIGGFNGPLVHGRPFFMDPNVGRSTGVCSSLAFRQQYCPTAVTLNRKLGKPAMGLWDAWSRLQQAGIAFNLATGRGVFIQGWISSAWSQVISCGESREEAIEMFERTKDALGM